MQRIYWLELNYHFPSRQKTKVTEFLDKRHEEAHYPLKAIVWDTLCNALRPLCG